MAVHRNLTGADLHEPKGADTALSGQVYVSDGAGSGSWTDASSIITNSAFTTGDTKITLKTSADTGWIMGSNGSIGDGSSSATIRANADCENLFLLLWTNFSNTLAPVSGGRGISAAADWAAHKRITLPEMWGRAIGVTGAGTGLTSRTLGAVVGAETHQLVTSELPSHTHANTLSDPGHLHSFNTGSTINYWTTTGGFQLGGGGGSAGISASIASAMTGITINNVAAGGGGSHNNMQPTVFLNLMIKL